MFNLMEGRNYTERQIYLLTELAKTGFRSFWRWKKLCNLFTEAEVSQTVKYIGYSKLVSKLSSHVERTLETFLKLGD